MTAMFVSFLERDHALGLSSSSLENSMVCGSSPSCSLSCCNSGDRSSWFDITSRGFMGDILYEKVNWDSEQQLVDGLNAGLLD